MARGTLAGSLSLLLLACEPAALPPTEYPPLEAPSSSHDDEGDIVTLTLLATNDVHGHIERLPHLAGYVNHVRAAREADGGGVLLLSGGDMWQGTLASNMTEGAVMVRAFNAMRYDAAAVGNHEFDYGPVGAATTPQDEDDDPRGALRARAAEAEFALLSANLRDAETGDPVDWDPIRSSVLIERAGIKVGIVGLSTRDTPETTISANVEDLHIAPLAETATIEARRLRERGATVVILTAHAGARCGATDDPHDLSSCEDEEVMAVVEAIPSGLVDAVVSGHLHQGMAHFVAGVPVVQQFSYGYAFGRVDLQIDRATGRVREARIHPPRDVCQDRNAGLEDCVPGPYEGRRIAPDPATLAVARPALAAAAQRMARSLEVSLEAPFTRSRDAESPLGNLLADLMLEVRPRADVALFNGGGVRADLPAGTLRYGSLYEAFPFDNRFANIRLSVAQLRELVANNLVSSGGTFILSGVRVEARCAEGSLEVTLRDGRGRRLPDGRRLTVVTSDYLATTPSFRGLPEGSVEIEGGAPMREALADRLAERGGRLRPADIYEPSEPRISLPMERPVRCPLAE